MSNTSTKILFYISTIREGGAARVMVNLANQFAKMKYDVIFVTNFPNKNEYTLDKKIKRISLEKEEIVQNALIKNIIRIRALRAVIRTYTPQYCIGFMIENNVRLLCATCWMDTKSIISIRTDPKKKYRGIKGYLIGKILYRLADGIVFQTKEAQQYFPKVIQQKSAIIFNPVAEKFYQTMHSNSSHHIVTCGRLSEEKRHDLLIKAFAHIAAKFPEENLLIYGRGNKETMLHQLISQLNLQNRVFLMNQSTHIEQVLTEAKLFVLSSDYEGMPNALMEAMSVGVPSISTDCPCGGPRELIKSGKNGLLVPCDDENVLAQALDKMLSNPQRAMQMGENSRQAAQQFRPEIILKQWEKLLNKIITAKEVF